MLSVFNNRFQKDYFYILELSENQLLHAADTTTAFLETSVMFNTNMGQTSLTLESIWINKHGPPKRILTEPEFYIVTFQKAMPYFSVEFEPTTARHHNKIECVKINHSVVKDLCTRLKSNAKATYSKDAAPTSDSSFNITVAKILSGATYLSNILSGS